MEKYDKIKITILLILMAIELYFLFVDFNSRYFCITVLIFTVVLAIDDIIIRFKK